MRMGYFTFAICYCLSSFFAIDSLQASLEPGSFRELQIRALRLHWQGESKRAAEAFQECAGLCREEQGKYSSALARILLSMGWAQMMSGDLSKAGQSFAESLSIAEDLPSPSNHSGVTSALRALAILHERRGNFNGAMEKYERCIELLSENQGVSKRNLIEVTERYLRLLEKMPKKSSWFGIEASVDEREINEQKERIERLRKTLVFDEEAGN